EKSGDEDAGHGAGSADGGQLAVWVEEVACPVCQEVRGGDAHQDAETGEHADPPLARERVGEAFGDHDAPLWGGDLRPEADEAERGETEDRVAEHGRGLDQHRGPRVGSHVLEQYAKPRDTERLRGL